MDLMFEFNIIFESSKYLNLYYYWTLSPSCWDQNDSWNTCIGLFQKNSLPPLLRISDIQGDRYKKYPRISMGEGLQRFDIKYLRISRGFSKLIRRFSELTRGVRYKISGGYPEGLEIICDIQESMIQKFVPPLEKLILPWQISTKTVKQEKIYSLFLLDYE